MMLLSGTLEDLDLVSIAAMTSLGRSSLRLELREPTGNLIGSLVLKGGRVVSATAGSIHGRAALRVLMSSSSDARFQLAREPLDFVVDAALTTVDELGHLGRAATRSRVTRLPTGSNGDAGIVRPGSGAQLTGSWSRVRMMQGRLDEFDLLTLLQTIGLGRQLVELEIRDCAGAQLGVIRVKSGKVVSAQTQNSDGVAAISELLRASDSFEFAAYRLSVELDDPVPLASVAEISVRLASAAFDPSRAPRTGSAADLDVTPLARGTDKLPRSATASRSTALPSPDDRVTPLTSGVVVMEGGLSAFDVRTILEVLAATRQHARLQIFPLGQPPLGEVALKAGWIVESRAGVLQGIPAIAFLLAASPRLQFRVLTGVEGPEPGEPLGSVQDVLARIPAARASRSEPASRILRWAIPLSFALGGSIVLLLTRGDGLLRPLESQPTPVMMPEAPASERAAPSSTAVSSSSGAVAPSAAAVAPSTQTAAPASASAATPVAAVSPAPVQPEPRAQPAASPASDSPAAAPPPPAPLRPGLSIKNAQAAFRQLGYDPGPIDNVYGPLTRKAILQFQRSHRLPATGALDQETWSAIVVQLMPRPAAR